jgi:hypothetical protein
MKLDSFNYHKFTKRNINIDSYLLNISVIISVSIFANIRGLGPFVSGSELPPPKKFMIDQQICDVSDREKTMSKHNQQVNNSSSCLRLFFDAAIYGCMPSKELLLRFSTHKQWRAPSKTTKAAENFACCTGSRLGTQNWCLCGLFGNILQHCDP